MVEPPGNRKEEEKNPWERGRTKKTKKTEKTKNEKQVPYTIWYKPPVVKAPSGGGSYLNDQSAGSGYHDLGPLTHAGHDREVYRHFDRLIIAGLENQQSADVKVAHYLAPSGSN